MGAKKKARKEFEKEQELEKLRAKTQRKEEVARAVQEREAAKIAAMSPEEKEAYLRKQAKTRKIALIITLVAVLFFVIAIFSGGSGDVETPATPSANASFSGEIISSKVINPATVNVSFKITNDGTDPGKPNCKVSVQDSSGTYRGYDYPIFDYSVEPKSSVTGNINLTVTKEGALFVTQGEVSCS